MENLNSLSNSNLTNNALVGVLINGTVVYNILLEEPEFSISGLSIIHQMRTDLNSFVGKIFESQSYDGIDFISNQNVKFSSYLSESNQNIETFSNISNFIQKQQNKYFFNYFYIIDYANKLLIVKIPDTDLVALDYTNKEDVSKFRNSINEIIKPIPERDF